MTFNVFGGTLSFTQSINHVCGPYLHCQEMWCYMLASLRTFFSHFLKAVSNMSGEHKLHGKLSREQSCEWRKCYLHNLSMCGA